MNRQLESWINNKHNVLGKILKPYSLHHYILMQSIDSPLLSLEKNVTISDFEIAVLICRSSFGDSLIDIINTESTVPKLKNWLWHKINTRRNLALEMRKWVAYQNDYISLPTLWERNNSNTDQQSNIPFEFYLLISSKVIQYTGWSEQVVYNMPIGKLVWYAMTMDYIKTGETSVMSDKEIEITGLLENKQL